MSDDNLRESVSALMDGEGSELELRRILRQAEDDPELLDQWRRYHLVRDVLHQQVSTPASAHLLAGIHDAIDELGDSVELPDAAEAGQARRRMPAALAGFGRALGQGAIAASVAMVVLFTAHQLNSPGAGVAPTVAESGASAGTNSGVARLTAISANNEFVESQFSRTVGFDTDGESGLDDQTRDRLRRAIHREFQQSSRPSRSPIFYIEHLQE